MTAARATDLAHLHHAARLAFRGHGGAEPNPLVGCVVVVASGEVVGWGYHRRCGGPHAERVALGRAGSNARGATVYLTLEPCSHTGQTPPCTQLLIDSGVARVVIARRDPNPLAAGGADRLRAAGIEVDVVGEEPAAVAVSDPFVQRVTSGLPWVVVKWAQTLDGRIATRSGESRWISNESSRRLVHRERGRVDAILTGIGTVLRDDPLLTARDVRRRRIARRVVIDPDLETPTTAKLVQTIAEAPTTIACAPHMLETDQAATLRAAGVELLGIASEAAGLPLEPVLRELVNRHDITNVLVEAGPGLLRRLFEPGLVNEAWVFVSPLLLGDEEAVPPIKGLTAARLTDGITMGHPYVRQRGGDVILRYRVGDEQGARAGSVKV